MRRPGRISGSQPQSVPRNLDLDEEISVSGIFQAVPRVTALISSLVIGRQAERYEGRDPECESGVRCER